MGEVAIRCDLRGSMHGPGLVAQEQHQSPGAIARHDRIDPRAPWPAVPVPAAERGIRGDLPDVVEGAILAAHEEFQPPIRIDDDRRAARPRPIDRPASRRMPPPPPLASSGAARHPARVRRPPAAIGVARHGERSARLRPRHRGPRLPADDRPCGVGAAGQFPRASRRHRCSRRGAASSAGSRPLRRP